MRTTVFTTESEYDLGIEGCIYHSREIALAHAKAAFDGCDMLDFYSSFEEYMSSGLFRVMETRIISEKP